MSSTITELTVDELLKEKEEIPCETPDPHCDSNHKQPATWIGTHPCSTGTCSQLLCQACVDEYHKQISLLRLLARAMPAALGMVQARCHKCREIVDAKKIILRKI